MIERGPPQAWLPEPSLELFRGPEGEPEGAYIRLATGKQRRQEQPLASALVFLCWGFDGYPTAVKLLVPAPQAAQETIVQRLRDGPGGLDLPIGFVPALVHQLVTANAALADAVPTARAPSTRAPAPNLDGRRP